MGFARFRSLTQDASALLVGTAVNGIASYAYVALGTRIYGAESFAPVSVLWTLFAVGVAVLGLPVQHWVQRTTRAEGPEAVASDLRGVTVLVLCVSGSFSVVSAALAGALFGDRNLVWPLLVFVVIAGSALTGYVRGMLAAQGQYVATANALGGENVLRLGAAALVVILGGGIEAFAFTLAVGSLIVLVWPSTMRISIRGGSLRARAGRTLRSVGGIAGGSLVSQIVLNAGPAVLAVAGGSPSEVTALFAALAVFRAPYLLALGVSARVTGTATGLVVQGRYTELRGLIWFLAGASVAGAGPAFAFGYWAGLPILQLLFGPTVVMVHGLVGVIAVASWLALCSFGLTLILIALRQEGATTVIWTGALAVALVCLLAVPAGALVTVAVALLAGECAATLLLALRGLHAGRRMAARARRTS